MDNSILEKNKFPKQNSRPIIRARPIVVTRPVTPDADRARNLSWPEQGYNFEQRGNREPHSVIPMIAWETWKSASINVIAL